MCQGREIKRKWINEWMKRNSEENEMNERHERRWNKWRRKDRIEKIDEMIKKKEGNEWNMKVINDEVKKKVKKCKIYVHKEWSWRNE